MNMKKKTLLYIEDNEDHARILELTLKKLGISLDFQWVRSGEEALNYLLSKAQSREKRSGMPDLILIDLKLTGADGFSVIHAIKSDETLKLIPVIVLTSSEDQDDIRKAYQNYANSYIAKSIETSAYRKQIAALVQYWTEINFSPNFSDE